ncbi:hypothetical protein NDI39_01880 [Microcoleus sp. ZQ-A2]
MTSAYRFSNSELTQKLVKGVESLSRLREEDIQIGATPKEEVYREDKVVLYRFTPKVEPSLNIPILIVYALVNRPYIVDLQEGRSLVANLLNLGMDVYLIDWGYPTKIISSYVFMELTQPYFTGYMTSKNSFI